MLDTLQRLEELSSHSAPLRLAREDEADFSSRQRLRREISETVDKQLRELRLLFAAGAILIIGISLISVALVSGLAPIVPPYLTAACLGLLCIFLGFGLGLSSRFKA